ncbi:MAG: YidC/Oxa1 family membrane protein insertase [Clostridia bacterium]|nr:YidC/Oxa1 family membrane protein insertase [Clostridia bacterium]
MNEFLCSILNGINGFVGNYGWAVVVFTLLIRLVLMPFDYKSRVSMRNMTKVQPQIAAIQKKYAKDQEKMNQKLSELYRKEKINPIGGCLPMLLTLPILYAMFGAMRMVANQNLINQVFAMLQGQEPVLESWLWIKNIWVADSPFASVWPDHNALRMITDASLWQNAFAALGNGAANLPAELGLTMESFASGNLNGTIESIFSFLATQPAYQAMTAGIPGLTNMNLWITSITVMQHYNGLFILPLLAAGTQYLMTLVQPTAPAGDAQQQSTGNFMKWFFPLFSLWICSSYNAIFSIYWVTSNVIASVQNWGINKYLDAKDKKNADVEVSIK